MAYNVSEDYRKVIYSGGAISNAILKINGVEIPNRQIEKIEISDPFFDNQAQTFYLGQFVSKQIIIKFKNTDNIPIEGNVDLSIATMINDEWESVPIGKFVIETNKEDYYNNSKLTCLDYAVKMKTNCDYSSLIVSDDGTITPVSLENLLKWICDHYQIELGTYPDVNRNYLISTYDNTLSGKYYISQIAELMGSNAHFGRDGKLYLIPIKQSSVATINALKSESFVKSNSYTINKVVFDDGIRSVTLGESENVLYIRADNMFVLDNYEELITNIYNAVKGTNITSIKTKNYGDVSLDCFDLITYTLGEERYNTFYNNKIVFEQVLSSTVETSIPTLTQQSTTNVIQTSDSTKIRRIQSEVDQINGTLKIVSEQTDENSSKIGSLSVSNDNLKVQVSSIEKGLSTTNTNLETTNKNVTNLQTQINGVSADFEDFKDNEYVQSINNLQSQIDGAIQFWNGADIPTLNNYPASEWETEAERINHQADIYTVIEDVEGELKQGKAYRFDKVDGVWQWIELTDNELSAVQALAQEALNKANTNTSDIKVLKQTDTEIKADINGINLKYDTLNNDYQANLTTRKSVSGNPAYIEDSGGYALEKDFIYGMSIQEISTQGKNIVPTDFSEWSSGDYTGSDGKPTTTATRLKVDRLVKVEPNTTYFARTSSYNFVLREYDSTQAFVRSIGGIASLGTGTTFTTGANGYYIGVAIYEGTDYATFEANWDSVKPFICLNSETDKTFEEFIPNMPSPDYPSEIENVRGIENLFNLEEYPFANKLAYDSGGNQVYWTGYCGISKYYPVEENETYTFSNNLNKSLYYGLVFYDEDKNILSYITAGTKTFTTPTNCKYIRFAIQSDTLPTWVQIEKGTIAHTPVPFGSNYLVQKITGKNLCDGFLNNYMISNSGNVSSNTSWNLSDYIKVKQNEKYTFSHNDNTSQQSLIIAEFDENKTFIVRNVQGSLNENKPFELTTSANTKYVRLSYNNTFGNEKFQFERGTKTEYENYKEKLILFDLQGNKLCAKDNAELVSGALTKNVKELVLTGNEAFTENGIYSGLFALPNMAMKSSEYDIIVTSTHFKSISQNKMFIDLETGYNNDLVTSAYTNDRLFIVYKKYAKNLAGFKAFLKEQYEASTPVIIQYEMAAPEVIQLEPTEIITYEGINNIYTESNVDVEEVDITYLTDSVLNSQYATRSEVKIAEGRIEANVSNTTTILQNEIDETNNSLATTDARVDSTATDLQNQLNDTNKKFNNYASTATVTTIQNSVTSIQTSLNAQIAVTKDIQENGVSKVKTSTNYTFDEDGLNIEKSDESNKSTIDNNGIEVTRDNGSTRTFFAGYDEETGSSLVDADNMTVDDHLIMMNHVRVEEYTDSSTSKTGVGFFWIG